MNIVLQHRFESFYFLSLLLRTNRVSILPLTPQNRQSRLKGCRSRSSPLSADHFTDRTLSKNVKEFTEMKLAYETFLPADEELDENPVIMIHCAFDSGKTWFKVAPIVAAITGRKVFALDVRNHGDSSRSANMSWSLLAEDLEEFLDDHNIQKAVLIGHGMGGTTALAFALSKPERVEKLVIDGVSPNQIRTEEEECFIKLRNVMEDCLKAVSPDIDESVAKETILKFIEEKFEDQPSPFTLFDTSTLPIRKQGTGFSWQTNIDVLLNFQLNGGEMHEISNRRAYKQDTLFLYGIKSPSQIKDDPLLRKLFPRAVIVGLNERTHVVRQENPQRYGKMVAHFIKGLFSLLAKY